MSSFALDLRAFSDRVGLRLDKVCRKVVIDMTSEIVKMTPVDTGHARSNYFWGFSRVGTIDPTKQTSGASSINRAVAFSEKRIAGSVVYLTNNLPYILRLEFGHSQQAPAGMARITVARFQQLVNSALAGVR